MSDYALDDNHERRDYRSYLLRLWRVGPEEAAWRASLESPHTGEHTGFASLEDLFGFLEKEVRGVAQGQTTSRRVRKTGSKGGGTNEWYR
jgi:hypothetical protein